jgi:hypothetical protein
LVYAFSFHICSAQQVCGMAIPTPSQLLECRDVCGPTAVKG